MGSRTGVMLSADSLEKMTKRQQVLGLTDGEVADAIGVSRVMYLFVRSGQRKACVETIMRLCKIMGFRLVPARLVREKQSPPAP